MKLSALSAVVACLFGLVTLGCGTKDTDPHEKIDAPGYYNGPMDARGGKGGAKSGAGGGESSTPASPGR